MEMSTNVSGTLTSPQDDSSDTTFFVNIVIGSMGMIGNAFVCFVMLRHRNIFNSTTNKLITHQSFLDFLASFTLVLRRFLVIDPPATVPENFLGSLYCKLWWSEWALYGTYVTSTYNLVAISIERYFATCQPVKHRNMLTNHLLPKIIAAAWLCGWLPQTHILPISYQQGGECHLMWPYPSGQALWGVTAILIDLIIPLTIMVFAYTKVVLELRRRSKARAGDNNKEAKNMLSRANKNVTKTLVVVGVFFAICWTPTEINYLLYNLGLHEDFSISSAVHEVIGAVVVVNLCINPFIYCFTYERFQNQAKKMVFGRCQRTVNRVDITNGSTRQEANAQHNEQE